MAYFCKNCNEIIKSAIYSETGLEHYCKCQCTLQAEFDNNKWRF